MVARWVGEYDGHWEIYRGNVFMISCDDNELTETLKEIGE